MCVVVVVVGGGGGGGREGDRESEGQYTIIGAGQVLQF